MKNYIYLFTLALVLTACCSKKNTSKTAENTTVEKKELTEEERILGLAEEMKKQEMPNEAEDYYEYAEKEMPLNAIARIQRTPCFGKCPTYTLTVFENGRLEYFGKRFTPQVGMFTAKMTDKEVNSIVEKAIELNYFELDSVYDNINITDLPSTITSVRNNGKLKTVVNRFDSPKNLLLFEKYFDNYFANVVWLPIESK